MDKGEQNEPKRCALFFHCFFFITTVPFRSIQQSRVTGLLASPKCHGGHDQFGQVPNLFEDMINKNNKNKNLPRPTSRKKGDVTAISGIC
jgi:hypothetical protein